MTEIKPLLRVIFVCVLSTVIFFSRAKAKSISEDSCFQAYKQMMILALESPIKTDGQGNYFPRWMLDYGSVRMSYVKDKDRASIVDETKQRLNTACLSEAESEGSEIAAIMYWRLQKSCSKPLISDKAVEGRLLEDISAF